MAARWRGLPPEGRRLAIVVLGIALGVLLLLTAVPPVQAVGWLLVAGALLVARLGSRIPEAWLDAPGRSAPVAWRAARAAAPGWAWPAAVGALVLVALGVMAQQVVRRDGWSLDAAGEFAEGAIGAVMLATLALWRTTALPARVADSRLGRSRLFRAPESAPLPSPEPSGDTPA